MCGIFATQLLLITMKLRTHMEISKENIFVIVITLLVIAGGVHVRISDKRYKSSKSESGSIADSHPIIGKDMAVQGLSCGSAVATEGSMMYLFINDTCTVQYDFKSKIRSVNFDDDGVSVAVSDTIYHISYNADSTTPSNFASPVPPIPVASLNIFSHSVITAE